MTILAGGRRRTRRSGAELELPFEFGGLDNATPPLMLEYECAIVRRAAQPRRGGWEACDSPYTLEA